jgi:hypothetical protein
MENSYIGVNKSMLSNTTLIVIVNRESEQVLWAPSKKKNKCQTCLGKFRKKGKFYDIYSKVKIGMALKDNPAFFHMGAVPKGWKLL